MSANTILVFAMDQDGTEVCFNFIPRRDTDSGYWVSDQGDPIDVPDGFTKMVTGKEPAPWEDNQYISWAGPNYDPTNE